MVHSVPHMPIPQPWAIFYSSNAEAIAFMQVSGQAPNIFFCSKASLTSKWGMFGRTPPVLTCIQSGSVRKWTLQKWMMGSWWGKYSPLPFLGWIILRHILNSFSKGPSSIEVYLTSKVTKLRTHYCKDPGKESKIEISQKKIMIES